MAERANRQVILVDTFELLSPLEDWLREAFLPELPGDVPPDFVDRGLGPHVNVDADGKVSG